MMSKLPHLLNKTTRDWAKRVAPDFLTHQWRQWRNRRVAANLEGRSAEEIFTYIYENGVWGAGKDDRFFSGQGSHRPDVVEPYINAVLDFLQSFERPPDVVDLGCGDFAVGARLRASCGRYIACDIVQSLVARNSERYQDLDVDFRHLNMAVDPLPAGDVALIRQALQHMSNADIHAALDKARTRYRFLVITEELPLRSDFKRNIDKPTGAGTRLAKGGGIDVAAPPFALTALQTRVLCEIRNDTRTLTTLYQMR